MTRETDSRQVQQRAFDRMAPQLDFELGHASFEVGEHTDVGIVFGILMQVLVHTPIHDRRLTVGPDDDEAIRGIIEGWESLSPRQYKESFQEFANDPYLMIGEEGVGQVGSGPIEDEDQFARTLEHCKVFTPRRATVTNIQIAHLGGGRAAAIYAVDEELEGGTSFHGNAVAVLAKLQAGWRIVIGTDHLHA